MESAYQFTKAEGKVDYIFKNKIIIISAKYKNISINYVSQL